MYYIIYRNASIANSTSILWCDAERKECQNHTNETLGTAKEEK